MRSRNMREVDRPQNVRWGGSPPGHCAEDCWEPTPTETIHRVAKRWRIARQRSCRIAGAVPDRNNRQRLPGLEGFIAPIGKAGARQIQSTNRPDPFRVAGWWTKFSECQAEIQGHLNARHGSHAFLGRVSQVDLRHRKRPSARWRRIRVGFTTIVSLPPTIDLAGLTGRLVLLPPYAPGPDCRGRQDFAAVAAGENTRAWDWDTYWRGTSRTSPVAVASINAASLRPAGSGALTGIDDDRWVLGNITRPKMR